MGSGQYKAQLQRCFIPVCGCIELLKISYDLNQRFQTTSPAKI
jgi:hypothetical protein